MHLIFFFKSLFSHVCLLIPRHTQVHEGKNKYFMKAEREKNQAKLARLYSIKAAMQWLKRSAEQTYFCRENSTSFRGQDKQADCEAVLNHRGTKEVWRSERSMEKSYFVRTFVCPLHSSGRDHINCIERGKGVTTSQSHDGFFRKLVLI